MEGYRARREPPRIRPTSDKEANVAQGTCSVDGCDYRLCARGWCRIHYAAWWRYGDPLIVKGTNRRVTVRNSAEWQRQRLLASIAVTDSDQDCWLWKGCVNAKTGYGRVSSKGRPSLPHRIAYELLRGPIPDGLTIDHLCRVRLCCNPSHMEAVTMKVNDLRGTSPMANNARKTHCVHGHALAGGNLYLKSLPTGGLARICLTCRTNQRALDDQRRRERARARGHW